MREKHTDPRSVFTKTMLKKACISMLGEKDISHITIHQLCDQAGVNRSTFYRYYPDIYALYEEIEDEFCAVFTQRIPSESLKEPASFVLEIMRAVQSLPGQEREFFRSQKHIHVLEKIMEYYHPRYVAYLRGTCPGLGEAEREYVFSVLAGCISGLVYTWIDRGLKEDPEELCALGQKIVSSEIMSTSCS